MNKYDEMLRDVAEEAMDSLAFVMAMPDDEPSQSPSVAARIRFSGPFDGAMFILASPEMLPVIAANMLGMMNDEGISEQHQFDAFKEMLNVICGNFLPIYAGDEAVFNVAPAEILSDNQLPSEFEGQDIIASTDLVTDAGRATLVLFAASHECVSTQ